MTSIVHLQLAGLASESTVTAFEQTIGFSLPTEYRSFILEHNGGSPVPDALMITVDEQEEEDIVMCFFPLRDEGQDVAVEGLDKLHVWPLISAWKDLQTDLKNLYERELHCTMLPIGTDGATNYFCIALDGDQTGSIWFLESEMAETCYLAENFTVFLDSLRARERNDYDQ